MRSSPHWLIEGPSLSGYFRWMQAGSTNMPHQPRVHPIHCAALASAHTRHLRDSGQTVKPRTSIIGPIRLYTTQSMCDWYPRYSLSGLLRHVLHIIGKVNILPIDTLRQQHIPNRARQTPTLRNATSTLLLKRVPLRHPPPPVLLESCKTCLL